MQFLKKTKKYLLPWLIFFIGQTWVMGFDAILRLEKPRIFNGYIGIENREHYTVAIHGIPEVIYFGLIYLIVGYAVYQWFRVLGLNKWRSMARTQKAKRSLIFVFSLVIGAVVHLYMLFWYVIETGIDSL